MNRGEVWIGVWPNDPTQKPRPLLIVSNNFKNRSLPILDVVVVKLTSLEKKDGSQKPINPAEDIVHKFKKPTIIRCGSIYSVEKILLKTKIETLSPKLMSQVDASLRLVLDLN